jgi:hypothetical protein
MIDSRLQFGMCLERTYKTVVGSTPNPAAWGVINALTDDTKGDESAIGCWITILQEALAAFAPD